MSAPRLRLRGFGFVDLLAVGLAVFAVWSNTPVGGLGQWAWAWASDAPEQPSLVAFFRSDGPRKAWLDAPVVEPPPPPDAGDGFPEPYRTALRYALPETLPTHTTQLLEPSDEPPQTRLLAWLDENWAGDPEAALEIAAIGEELRARAIERARAAGESDPHRFDVHRRYLPQSQAADAAALVDSVFSLATVFDLRWPVDPSIPISSPFGHRKNPVTGKQHFHNGVDVPVPVGTELRAAQSGKIVAATENAVSGKYVILEHAGGVRTTYCHLSALPEKRVGAAISKGEVIGASGNTGRSTGPHLHFILRVDGTPIDAAPYRRVPRS